MNEYGWAFLGVLVTQSANIGIALVAAKRARRAATYSEPTSNGFAHEVKESLRILTDRVDRLYDIVANGRNRP